MHSFEDVQKLSDKVWLYKANKTRPVNANEYSVQEDNDWGASYFFADVLLNSYFQEDVLISRERLDELAVEFEHTGKSHIDPVVLFERNWLRMIFGLVTVPYLIHSAISRFEKIIGFYDEFKFFDGLTPEQIKSVVNEQQLLSLAAGCDSKNEALLILETKNIFWYDKNNRIELPCLDFDRFLFEHRDEFEFLSYLHHKQADNDLLIDYQKLPEIHAAHTLYFKKTPPLRDLVAAETLVIDKIGSYYRINLRTDGGWSKAALRDKYSAVLWQKLIDDNRYGDDKERLRFWYYRTVYHWGYVDIENFFPAQTRIRFLETALNMVVTDPDLESGDQEFYKLRTDTRFGRDLELLSSPEKPKELIGILDSEDLFELYANLGDILRGHSENLLYDQRSRHALTYFIYALVRNDTSRAHNLINGLFENANKQPFVFWYACLMIVHWRPELLPNLALDERTASLAFALFMKMAVSSYVGKDHKTFGWPLIKEFFELTAGNIAQLHTVSQERKSKIIFQCLLRTTLKKFRMEPDKDGWANLSAEIGTVLAETELPGQHYVGGLKVKKLLYPELLDELFNDVATYQQNDIFQNGMTSLPFIQLDIAVMLMSLASQKDYSGSTIGTPEQFSCFTTYFKETYLDTINIDKVQKRDFFGDGELKPAMPSWHDQRVNEALISWDTACLHMEKSFELDQFLSPAGLIFSSSAEKYDEQNRFTAQKLRTHLFVLIEAFNKIYNNRRHFEHTGYPVISVLAKLEIRIKDYVIRYSVSDPTSRRYDIFNESLERWFGRAQNTELLPLIGTIINRFTKENREAVVVELTKSEQFLRSLKILEQIVSEKERRRLLKILTDSDDFILTLDKLSFLDMQFVVSSLSQNEDFIAVAEDALAYTEMVSEEKVHSYTRNENKAFIFRMKLMQAFQKRSIEAIDQVPDLDTNHYHGQQFSSEEEKDFYRALVYLRQGNGKTAYELFHKLVSNAQEDRPVLALNRFAAKLQWADETKEITEKRTIAYDALNQWTQFETGYPDNKSWPAIRENIWYNRLHAHELLEDYENFDKTYAEIDPITRMRSDFLAIRLEVLLKRKMQHQAEEILNEAKIFHQLADSSYPDFIEGLEKLTNTPEALSFLSAQYDRIFRLPPEEIIQVIPALVNGGKDLGTFLLNELLQSSKDMLNLVNVLPDINYEDKYTDLLMVSLNGRLINYKWHAANLRSGFSDNADGDEDKKDNPGEIDFGILTSSNKRLAICEALILEGKNTFETQKHNLKIFNYDPSRKLFYIIAYYKGSVDSFDTSWESYVRVVEDFIEFPESYPLLGSVNKLTMGDAHEAIRAGKSTHGADTELYHLFINVNYRLTLNKKKVGT